jgi:hypothetical protein
MAATSSWVNDTFYGGRPPNKTPVTPQEMRQFNQNLDNMTLGMIGVAGSIAAAGVGTSLMVAGGGGTLSLSSAGAAAGVATKGVTKLLNQFNSAESLIQGAGNLTKVRAGMQGFVKGDGLSIFKAITNGGTRQANGTILMQDGTTIFNHFSTKTGVYTIDINKAGQIFKIRVGQ